MKEFAKILSLGSGVIFCILLPVYLGHWIDRQFGLSPLGILIGMALGLASAFYKLYEITKSYGKN